MLTLDKALKTPLTLLGRLRTQAERLIQELAELNPTADATRGLVGSESSEDPQDCLLQGKPGRPQTGDSRESVCG